MKILFTLRFFPVYGGGESVTIRLANELCERGVYVYIVYLWDRGNEQKLIINNNLKLIKVKNSEEPVNIFDLSQANLKKMKVTLFDIILNESIDIIVNQWWPERIVYSANNHMAKIIKCHHSAIKVESKRKIVISKIIGTRGYKILLKAFLIIKYYNEAKLCDIWVLLNEKYIADVQYLYGHIFDKKLKSIANPSKYNWEDCASDNKDNKVLFVGRFSVEKRIDILLQVWKEIEKEVLKKDWRLHIVGDGSLRSELEQLCSSLECKNIDFLGEIDPFNQYKDAKILVLTSSFEGFPMCVIEGMNFGCVPIVMNTFSACDEMIENGIDGLIIPDNRNDLSRALTSLIVHQDQLEQLSKNARRKSVKYSVKFVVDQWMGLFKNILEE